MDDPGQWTDLNTSPWGQCLNGIANAIIDLDLPEIGGNVYIREPPTLAGVTFPCILLRPFFPSHNPADGPVSQADVKLRVLVGVIAEGQRTVNKHLPNKLLWHSRLLHAFAKKSKPFTVNADSNAAQLEAINVEPGIPLDDEGWREGLDAMWLVLVCEVRYH